MRSSHGRLLLGVLVVCFPVALLAAEGKAGSKTKPAKLTASQIVQRHVAARGGLQAWRGVQSMVWSGQMEVGYADSAARSARYVSSAMARKGKRPVAQPAAEGKDDARKQVQVPFVLEMKRPAKSRIEIEFAGKKAVQVYDGTNGWLLRPYLNRDDWEPFTAEQAKSQQGRWELDGPLFDYAAKGTKVELVSVERVEGRDAYKLKLTRKSGQVQHVWIDAKSFLDVKVEGTPRRMDGKMRTVWVTQRDFRSVQGLMVPFVLETAVDGYADTHRMTIDKVALDPRLDDARFVKPKA
jgi:outer membrane lipoprotein-sorting protein